MNDAAGRQPVATEGGPRWLTTEEMAAWRPLVHLVTVLPQALDRQLRADAGISHVYYMILALLSEAPGRSLRMSELARGTGTSSSRLSHAVAALEGRGWVSRCPTEQDGRGQYAQLTEGGQRLLDRVAPSHVAEVRRLVLDVLTPEEVGQLTHLAEKLRDSIVR